MSKTKPWETKEWKEKRKEFLKDKKCSMCGTTENLVIHHPQKKNSLTPEKYVSFEGVKILCNSCHFAHHKRMNLCPKCKKKYKRKKYEMCFKCQFPNYKGDKK